MELGTFDKMLKSIHEIRAPLLNRAGYDIGELHTVVQFPCPMVGLAVIELEVEQRPKDYKADFLMTLGSCLCFRIIMLFLSMRLSPCLRLFGILFHLNVHIISIFSSLYCIRPLSSLFLFHLLTSPYLPYLPVAITPFTFRHQALQPHPNGHHQDHEKGSQNEKIHEQERVQIPRSEARSQLPFPFSGDEIRSYLRSHFPGDNRQNHGRHFERGWGGGKQWWWSRCRAHC